MWVSASISAFAAVWSTVTAMMHGHAAAAEVWAALAVADVTASVSVTSWTRQVAREINSPRK
jgi:hypothetical protein